MTWLENPDHDISMTYSLYYGIKKSEIADGYLICPIDHPFIGTSTIA